MAIWRPVIMLAKGLLRASGKAAIDTCGGGLVRQPVTLVALQVEPSKIVTFIVKRFTTKTVFVSNSTRIATGESRTGTIALGGAVRRVVIVAVRRVDDRDNVLAIASQV